MAKSTFAEKLRTIGPGALVAAGVPRTRGDDPDFDMVPLLGQECSPHTRG